MSHDTPEAPYNRHTLRHRKKTTIRVDPALWKEFREDLKKKGLSSCLVLDALVAAWVYSGAMVPGLKQPLKLNLTLEEHVSRRRRAGGEYSPPKAEPPRIPRKWSPRRVPRDARCIGCRHHGRAAEYNQAFQGILIYHWCKVRGRALCDVPDEVLRTCELRET